MFVDVFIENDWSELCVIKFRGVRRNLLRGHKSGFLQILRAVAVKTFLFEDQCLSAK